MITYLIIYSKENDTSIVLNYSIEKIKAFTPIGAVKELRRRIPHKIHIHDVCIVQEGVWN